MRNKIFTQKPLLFYFVLAFLITWLILFPGLAANLGLLEFPVDGTVLTFLSGVGPLLAASIVTGATKGRDAVSGIFCSMVNWRVRAKWWAASVLLVAALFGISAGVGMLIGGDAPNPSAGIYLNGENPILVVLLLLFGSFGEEPGWRGFALPRIQERHSPMKATLILTAVWWLWHLPKY